MRHNPGVCKRGHALTPANTYVRKNGKRLPRECRICRKEARAVEYRTRVKRVVRIKPVATEPAAPIVIAWPEYDEELL